MTPETISERLQQALALAAQLNREERMELVRILFHQLSANERRIFCRLFGD